TASHFRPCGCCCTRARPAAKRKGCTKPKQRNSSVAPPTRNWSTAFTILCGVSHYRLLRSRGCANCSRQSPAFPTPSPQDCDLKLVIPANKRGSRRQRLRPRGTEFALP